MVPCFVWRMVTGRVTGSVLGPLAFFNIFSNDLEVMMDVTLMKFAGDNKLWE